MWNAADADYRGFEDGDFVRVEGATQIFQGGLQLIATSICKARPEEILGTCQPGSPIGPAG